MDDFLAKPIRPPTCGRRLRGSRVPVRRPADRDRACSTRGVLLAACGGDADPGGDLSGPSGSPTGPFGRSPGCLRERDAIRLREAAHKLCGTVAAFSTVVGAVASDLEDQAAHGQLEEAWPLVEQLEAMAGELIEQVDGLSIETLRDRAAARDRDRTARHYQAVRPAPW